MIRVVVLLNAPAKRYTVIRADTGEVLKESGRHKTFKNCAEKMYKFTEQTKGTHKVVRIVHV